MSSSSINRRDFLRFSAAALAGAGLNLSALAAQGQRRPSVVFILADDLGWGDIGPFGQKKIKTPALDRMAAEGIRFTQAYCGTSVCAPSRTSLMTGLHTGHSPIRANREIQPEGQMPLPEGTYTLAKLFKQAGYATGAFGKWGMGMWGTTGDPLKNGFDYFFGHNCQRKAHEYYPEYLWRNGQKVELGGKQYSHDLIWAEAMEWVKANKERPFFLFLPITVPHGKYQVPDVEPYTNENWSQGAKKYAAMVTRMDRGIGQLLALLKELGIDENTIVFFASDNGAAEGGKEYDPKFFQSCAGFRGVKRSMYEGGLRSPIIARWPGHVPAAKVSDEPWAFWDFMPTCAELIGTKLPAEARTDGLSVLPALLGGAGPKREYFYWELHEGGSQQALRFDDWKAVKKSPKAAIELYDLKSDPAEKTDLAKQRPEIVAKAQELFKVAREDSPLWPLREKPAPRAATRPANRPAAKKP